MKKSILITLGLLIISLTTIAQMRVNYSLNYNQSTNLYEARAQINGAPGAHDYKLGPSAFCIAIIGNVSSGPSQVSANSVNPPNAQWSDNKPVTQNTFDGINTFHKMHTYGGEFNSNTVFNNANILLFTFSLPNSVSPSDIRIFENLDQSNNQFQDTNPPEMTYDNSFQTMTGEKYNGNLSISTGIDPGDPSNPDHFFNVYPNPTSDFINIQLLSNLNNVQKLNIYNAAGQIVESHIIQANELNTKIDVHTWADGIYFVHILTKDYLFQKKFVVRK